MHAISFFGCTESGIPHEFCIAVDSFRPVLPTLPALSFSFLVLPYFFLNFSLLPLLCYPLSLSLFSLSAPLWEGAPITAICGLCFPTLSVLPTFPDPFYPSRFPFLPLSCAGRRTEPPLSGSARLSLCLPLFHRPYDNGPALYLSGAIPPLSGGRGGRHATRGPFFFLSLLLSLLSVISLFFLLLSISLHLK